MEKEIENSIAKGKVSFELNTKPTLAVNLTRELSLMESPLLNKAMVM